MKPVCVPCERFMRAKKNGFYFTEGMGGDGRRGKHSTEWIPYKIWVGDLWECPDCKAQIVVGVGMNRLAEHYEPDFNDILEQTNAKQLLVKDC